MPITVFFVNAQTVVKPLRTIVHVQSIVNVLETAGAKKHNRKDALLSFVHTWKRKLRTILL